MSNEPQGMVSREQELLLKAAFVAGGAARSSWAEWQAQHDLDNIDIRLYPIFPQLYLNLRALGVEMAKHPRVQGIYRRCTYTNRMLLNSVQPALDALAQDGLSLMAVGPAASVVLELGCYPLDRFYLGIDGQAVVPAMAILKTLGWVEQDPHALGQTVLMGGASNLEHKQGGLMQIRWLSSAEAQGPGYGVSLDDDRSLVRVATGTKQLLDAAVPGMNWHRLPLFLRLTHAMLVLRYARDPIDWRDLTTGAQRQRVVLALLDVLTCARWLGAPVPSSAIEALRETPVPASEKYEYQSKIAQPTLVRRLAILWLNYRRASKRSADGGHKLEFADYLRMRWRMRSLWQLPRYLLGVVKRSIKGS